MIQTLFYSNSHHSTESVKRVVSRKVPPHGDSPTILGIEMDVDRRKIEKIKKD